MSTATITPTETRSRRATAVWWAAVAAVVWLGFALRAAHYHRGYGHPDEAITVEVVGHMRQSGDWDTNWAKAPKLEAGLRYDQYNFSSHLLATFGFYRLVKVLPGTLGWRSEDAGFWVYRFFSVLLAAVAVGQTLRLAARAGGRGVALGAGALAAVAPLLVQDGHFSRPEAFTTVLTLAVVGLCWPREKVSAARVGGAAFVLGLLVACKISMLAIAWLPLVPVVAGWRGTAARWRCLAMLPLALAAGFWAGAPGAVAHPTVFVSGVQHLMTQYAGLHPPNSHLNGGPVGDMMVAYFAATFGWPVLAAGVLGIGVLAGRRCWAELALIAGPVVVFAGYFATRGVFFERNLSHVAPLFLILAAVGAMAAADRLAAKTKVPAWAVGGAIFALLLVRPAQVTVPLVHEAFSGRGGQAFEAFDRSVRAQNADATWQETALVNEGPLVELTAHFKAGRGPVLLRVTDYNDEWTAFNLRGLAARFETKAVADYPGTFGAMPVCTLLTYHSSRERYFRVIGLK